MISYMNWNIYYSGRSTVVSSSGNKTLRENITDVFGPKQVKVTFYVSISDKLTWGKTPLSVDIWYKGIHTYTVTEIVLLNKMHKVCSYFIMLFTDTESNGVQEVWP